MLVIESEGALEKLKGCTPYHFNTPLAFLACYDADVAWRRKEYDGHDSGEIDASIVGTHLMMAAEEQGIGNVWVMHFDPAAIRKAYNLPVNYIPVALFPMGYPAEGAKPSRLHSDRHPIEDTTRYNTF